MSMNHAGQPHAAVPPGVRVRDVLTVLTVLGAALLLVLPWGLVWATVVWLIGVGLLWSSPSWTTRDRTIGTLVWPGGLIGPVLLSTSVGQVCTQVLQGNSGVAVGEPTCTGFAFNPWIGLPLGVLVLVAPFAVAAFLLTRSRST